MLMKAHEEKYRLVCRWLEKDTASTLFGFKILAKLSFTLKLKIKV